MAYVKKAKDTDKSQEQQLSYGLGQSEAMSQDPAARQYQQASPSATASFVPISERLAASKGVVDRLTGELTGGVAGQVGKAEEAGQTAMTGFQERVEEGTAKDPGVQAQYQVKTPGKKAVTRASMGGAYGGIQPGQTGPRMPYQRPPMGVRPGVPQQPQVVQPATPTQTQIYTPGSSVDAILGTTGGAADPAQLAKAREMAGAKYTGPQVVQGEGSLYGSDEWSDLIREQQKAAGYVEGLGTTSGTQAVGQEIWGSPTTAYDAALARYMGAPQEQYQELTEESDFGPKGPRKALVRGLSERLTGEAEKAVEAGQTKTADIAAKYQKQVADYEAAEQAYKSAKDKAGRDKAWGELGGATGPAIAKMKETGPRWVNHNDLPPDYKELLLEFDGSDAAKHWIASTALYTNSSFDTNVMENMANKVNKWFMDKRDMVESLPQEYQDQAMKLWKDLNSQLAAGMTTSYFITLSKLKQYLGTGEKVKAGK